MINRILKALPGFLLIASIAAISYFLGKIIPQLGGVVIAIVLGIIIGNIVKIPSAFNSGIVFGEKKLLSLALILLGAELELGVLTSLGLPALMLIMSMVLVTMGLAIFLGKKFNFARDEYLLIGIGNSICGSSAIAAVRPIIKPRQENVGLSVGVINLLGVVGMFLVPVITSFIGFSDFQKGAAIGGSLQAVGQVAAAGYGLNDQVGSMALLVKMGRVLLLGPIILIISLYQKKHNSATDKSGYIFPWFILGFFAFSLLTSFHVFPDVAVKYIKLSGKLVLMTAMVAIGLKIQIRDLINQGPRLLKLGIVLGVIQLGIVLLIVYWVF